LGALGISGMGGLKVAAQRAARYEPLQRRMAALQSYLGKVSSADLLLEEEKAKALQIRQQAELSKIKASQLAADLTKSAGTFSPYVATVGTPLLSASTPTIKAPEAVTMQPTTETTFSPIAVPSYTSMLGA
jgi:hypothetical protein